MYPLMSPDYLIVLAPYLLFPIGNIPVFHSQTPSTLPCQEPDSMICRYSIPILILERKTMFYSVPTTNRTAPYVKAPGRKEKGKKKGLKKTQSCSARLPGPFRCYDNPPHPQRKNDSKIPYQVPSVCRRLDPSFCRLAFPVPKA